MFCRYFVKNQIRNLKSQIQNQDMPSGKTHDAITFFLVAPTFAATYIVTKDIPISTVVTFGMLFGGLMFGPDLDTMSKQYVRWGILKSLWYPYQAFFSHRSRWSHGLVFGTFIRVIYFMGVLTLFAFLISYIYATYTGGDLPNLLQMTKTWQNIGDFIRINIGDYAMPSLFVGLWLGAASHTFTDMAGTFVKTGRITEFL
ncbi:MAG: metal-binding protein [Pyrinomonadaceae bacterium]|nr:metal-binding protein [Pyrinomonadaceae bacterium]